MLEIGSLVDGKYRILSEIGRGGMSVVYMAINERANKTWAIKEVRKDGVIDFEAVKQGLIVETDILKVLKHSSLPSIIDVIEKDDTLLIVMDYIEGNPLSKALSEFGAQPQEYVIEWAKQICDVLIYLHTRNPAIIYRDLKPDNIMLKPDGNLTLIDFGTAREYKEKNFGDTICLGTIGYAAPEQYGGSGMGQTDARTDIYCLGATLYHLVTGYNPSEPPYEIKPIREINPTLSCGFESIIQKCVQRNPDDRYQSCVELMYALEHYEEIDKEYNKKQKNKLRLFFFLASLLIICAISNAMSVKLSQTQSNVGYILSGFFLMVTVLFFFAFNIPRLIEDISGVTARKAMESIRQQNADSGDKAYKPTDFSGTGFGTAKIRTQKLLSNETQKITIMNDSDALMRPEFIIDINLEFTESSEIIV